MQNQHRLSGFPRFHLCCPSASFPDYAVPVLTRSSGNKPHTLDGPAKSCTLDGWNPIMRCLPPMNWCRISLAHPPTRSVASMSTFFPVYKISQFCVSCERCSVGSTAFLPRFFRKSQKAPRTRLIWSGLSGLVDWDTLLYGVGILTVLITRHKPWGKTIGTLYTYHNQTGE